MNLQGFLQARPVADCKCRIPVFVCHVAHAEVEPRADVHVTRIDLDSTLRMPVHGRHHCRDLRARPQQLAIQQLGHLVFVEASADAFVHTALVTQQVEKSRCQATDHTDPRAGHGLDCA